MVRFACKVGVQSRGYVEREKERQGAEVRKGGEREHVTRVSRFAPQVGSGFDVCAAVYGSHRYTRFSPSVLAEGLALEAGIGSGGGEGVKREGCSAC